MTASAPDIALLRFLRTGRDDTSVLNDGGVAGTAGPDSAGSLVRAARSLLPAGEGVPYAAIAASCEFSVFRSLTQRLCSFDPASLRGRRQRTAFWINLFNALVIDAVISFGVRETVREAPGFFHRAAYQVGAYRFALDDIEHGLLRANRPLFPRLPPPLPPGDPRVALGPGVLDPRVHFALNCGTRSCPPVAFYDAARLDDQLDAAAAAFMNAEGVRLAGDEVILSPLFDFYAADFGGPDGVRSWALRYLVDPALRDRLTAGRSRLADYDWSLNSA